MTPMLYAATVLTSERPNLDNPLSPVLCIILAGLAAALIFGRKKR